MTYRQSIEGCLEATIGSGGLDAAGLTRNLEALKPHCDALKTAYHDQTIPLLRVPEWSDDLDEAEAALARLSDGARTLIFFGTGGSSLGGQVLAQLGGWFIPGEQRKGQLKRPRTRLYDNLDARTLERMLASIDLAASRFVVISKSGNTAETLVQFLSTLQAAKAAGLEKQIPSMFLALSEKASADNGLRAVCERYAIPVLEHHAQIPGRFSALTNVGGLAALARGLNMAALRKGAKLVVDEMLTAETPGDCAPALAAAVMVGLMQERGCNTSVMMPYSDRLKSLGHWYAQLWAESLGKNGKGSAPIAALGPVDQHSQLQFFLDGPPGQVITIVRHATKGEGPEIALETARLAGAGYLAGRRAGDLVDAQQNAIPQALIEAGRPVRLIDCGDIDEETLGSLMMHFMIETILAARLLGVNPFDQPAVEEGKRLTKEQLAGDAAAKEKTGGHSPVAAVDR
jgi:glucose-6-phosphate isomerase